MSGNPRKFSEKIAILTRKQNEDQKEYEKIMGEVRPLTHNAVPSTSQGLGPPLMGMWPRPGGSLPNVHEMVQPGTAMAIANVDPAAYPPGWPNQQSGIWPMAEPQRVIHPSQRARSPGSHPYAHHPYGGHHSPQGRGSPRQRSPERPMVPGIWSGGLATPFPGVLPPNQQLLEIPGGDGWRRTHSDPGINATLGAMGTPGSAGSLGSPHGSSPGHSPPQMHTPPSPQTQGSNFYLETKEGGQSSRPQSCENSPNIPATLNVSGSGAISSCSGSLPDLSSQLPLSTSSTNIDYSLVNTTGVVPQPPPYGQQAHLGQRHSIQFPVRSSPHYTQQQFSQSGGQYCNMQQSGSPSYTLAANPPYGGQEAQSQSAPNSPGNGGQDSSPVASPTSAAVVGMTNNLKNFTMEGSDQYSTSPQQQQQAWFHQQQQQLYHQQMSQGQQQSQYQSQQHHNHIHQQQYVPNTDVSTMQHYSGQQQAMSPKGGIPNIILTGDDGSVRGAATTVASMTDPSLDVFSDLNMSLDPNDLQMLMNNTGVDAADEESLRRDS